MASAPSGAGARWSSSVAFASAIGALAGATLTGQRGGRTAAAATLVGAVGLGASEALARARQRPGEIPAIWQRIAVSAALAAPSGWMAGRLTGAGPVAVGAATGLSVGALGLRPQKVALGPLVGAAIGSVAQIPGIGGGFQAGYIFCMTALLRVPLEQAVATSLIATVFSFVPTVLITPLFMLGQDFSLRDLKTPIAKPESEAV